LFPTSVSFQNLKTELKSFFGSVVIALQMSNFVTKFYKVFFTLQ